MALVTLNLKPSDKQLRDFGMAALVMLSLIGAGLWYFGRVSPAVFGIFCGSGAVLFVLARINVMLVKPVYQVLILVTFPIGWVISHAAMAIFFYGLITLIGLFFRLIGRDPMCRAYDRQVPSYWQPYRHKRTLEDYFRQF